jgi:RsiW-degrading membrane proteinase PrsW (M82 family)
MYIHQEPLNNGHIVVSLMGAFGFAMFMGLGYIYQRELEQAGLVGNSGALDEHLIDN